MTELLVSDTLAAAIKLGEQHLRDKVVLLNLIKLVLKRLGQGRVTEARELLKRAVDEYG
jgi:hypothetical protein